MTDRDKAILAYAESNLKTSARFLAKAEKDNEIKTIWAYGHAVEQNTMSLSALYELIFCVDHDEAKRRSSIFQEYTLNNWRRYYGLEGQPVWKIF